MHLSFSQLYHLSSGKPRYQYALEHLYKRFSANHCFIGKFADDGHSVSTLSYLRDGILIPNIVYQLACTPCKDAKSKESVCAIEDNLQALYPDDVLLTQLGVVSYLGITLRAPDNRPVGIMVCMFEQPRQMADEDKAWFTELSYLVAIELSHNLEMSEKEHLLKRLAMSERIAKISSWVWHTDEDRHWFSDEMASLLGIELTSLSFAGFIACLKLEDAQQLQRMLENVKAGDMTSFSLNVAHKFCDSNKGLFHIIARVESSPENPKSLVLRATVQDVSYASALLKQLELTDVVFKNASEAIMITDSQNRVMMVNRAFEQLTGYSGEELQGANPNVLSSGKQDKQFYKQMWQQLLEQGSWKGQIYNRRKNGQIYPEELSLNVVRDKQGNISNFVAIFHDISKWKRNEAELTFYANHEVLTGLLNRRSFMIALDKELNDKISGCIGKALLFIGLDRFKEVNDLYGPEAGDYVLVEVADRIQRAIKAKDIACRFGGDEFAVLMHNQDEEQALTSARDISSQLSEPYVFDELTIELTASVGVACLGTDSIKPSADWVRDAAHAMGNAKKYRQGHVALHSEVLQNAHLNKIKLRDKLKMALRESSLKVYYQPIIDLKTGRIKKFEALVRWIDTDFGMVSPSAFIPIAEEFGLIDLIGQHVLETSCRDLALLHGAGFDHISFSINRSVNEFKQSNSQLTLIPEAIEKVGLPLEAVTIEVTESVAANKYTWRVLDQLRMKGVQIALDDFCTGYSSLSNLIENQVDFVKIDKSFVDSLIHEPNKQILIKCLIDLSTQLGLEVIAEGVEHLEQLSMLEQFGCHLIQGYLYSSAKPIDECLAMLTQEQTSLIKAVDLLK